jgi:hypothetical protein
VTDPEPVVVVTAAVAARLEQTLLESAAVTTRRLGLDVDPAVAAVIADVVAAAAWWRAHASAPVDNPAETRSGSPPMTTTDAAAALGVTPHRVRQRLRAGTLPGHRDHAGRWRIDPAALEAQPCPN